MMWARARQRQGQPGQVWGTAPCPGLRVCICACECRGLDPVGLSSSSLVWTEPQTPSPQQSPPAQDWGAACGC